MWRYLVVPKNKSRVKRRPLISVYNQPTFVPSVIPPAPDLRFRDQRQAPSLGEVLFLPLDQLRAIPVGYLNLICATMLPDTINLDVPACMGTLGGNTSAACNVRRL
jgi:hypothetical protein